MSTITINHRAKKGQSHHKEAEWILSHIKIWLLPDDLKKEYETQKGITEPQILLKKWEPQRQVLDVPFHVLYMEKQSRSTDFESCPMDQSTVTKQHRAFTVIHLIPLFWFHAH